MWCYFHLEANVFFQREANVAEVNAGEVKFSTLAARAVFVSLFFLKKQLIYDFLAGNNYPDWPHWHGGMKFAT